MWKSSSCTLVCLKAYWLSACHWAIQVALCEHCASKTRQTRQESGTVCILGNKVMVNIFKYRPWCHRSEPVPKNLLQEIWLTESNDFFPKYSRWAVDVMGSLCGINQSESARLTKDMTSKHTTPRLIKLNSGLTWTVLRICRENKNWYDSSRRVPLFKSESLDKNTQHQIDTECFS